MVLTLGGVPSKYKRTTFSPDSYPLGFVESLLSGAQGVMGRKQERERERERERVFFSSLFPTPTALAISVTKRNGVE